MFPGVVRAVQQAELHLLVRDDARYNHPGFLYL
jgi:hypothetical protein